VKSFFFYRDFFLLLRYHLFSFFILIFHSFLDLHKARTRPSLSRSTQQHSHETKGKPKQNKKNHKRKGAKKGKNENSSNFDPDLVC